MSNVELKPCHVCGAIKGLYVLEDYEDLEWYVFCDNCKTSVHNENAQTKEDAIEIWNTRYEPPKLEPIFACASALVLKDERVEAAYRKGRFDERLQQQIFASAV